MTPPRRRPRRRLWRPAAVPGGVPLGVAWLWLLYELSHRPHGVYRVLFGDQPLGPQVGPPYGDGAPAAV